MMPVPGDHHRVSSPPKQQYSSDIHVYGGSEATKYAAALGDILEGLRRYEFWSSLAWNDVRARYRRSVIGEFWLTISLGIFVLSVGTVYALLMNIPISEYLPHLTIGYTFWLLFSSLVMEGCQTFIAGSSSLRHHRTPLTALVLRNVNRAFIAFAHNLFVLAVVLATFGPRQNWASFLVIPALALWGLNGMWLTMVVGIVCARFRDVPQIVVNLMQVLFLITPVLWSEKGAPETLQKIAFLNPLTHFLAIAREPLLGQAGQAISWLAVGAVTIAGWAIAISALRLCRSRIPYWV